jgi:ribonuclease P protein component
VPKRHARRAVTRSLLKRQIRAAALRRDAAGPAPLRPGLWVVRLRAPFDRKAFESAASPALRSAARSELDELLVQAERRLLAAPVGAR